MLRALLYLRLTSFKNWTLTRARRLRQPKYLAGAIVGVAYFYFFFFRPLGDATPGPAAGVAAAGLLPTDWLPLITAIGALALLFFTACMWVVPTERAHLGFSEAEIAFLFPAPVTRRALIHFRLLSAQFRSLAGAAVMMLFSNRWTFLGGNPLTHAIGWWFVFSALNLHLHGARFTLTRLADLGLGIWRRRLLVLALLAAIVAATFARLPARLSLDLAGAATDASTLSRLLLALADTAPFSWLLFPFEFILGPFLAADTTTFLFALGPALAVLTLHYLWVVHSAVAFEEAAVDHAQKRASLLAAWRAGGPRIHAPITKPRRPPFALPAAGRPELAFLWKNLLSSWPWFTWRVWLVSAAVLLAGGLWLNTRPALLAILPGFGFAAAIFAAYALIVGPQFARQDLRRDLSHADLLKTFPLAGWQIVLGQLLTPVAVLTGILWLAVLAVAVLTLPLSASLEWLTLPLRLTLAAALAVLVPPLAALQLLVPNAAALVFPGWFHTVTRPQGGGPEVVGQRMIFFFAQLVAMIIALLPAGALGASVFSITLYLTGPTPAIITGTLTLGIVLLAELTAGVWLLGRRFERLDLSADLRA